MMFSYLFFKGCTIPASLPNVEKLTLEVLPEIGINLIESDEFTCCPDPIRLQGVNQYFWMSTAARNITIAEEKKLNIMTLCNGCENTLAIVNHKLKNNPALKKTVNEALKNIGREFKGTIKIRHFLQVLKEDIGLDNLKKMVKTPLTGLKVAGHPGCHLLMPNEILKFDNPVDPEFYDQYIEALGATPVDYLTKTDCCGVSLALAGDKEASNRCVKTKLIDVQLSGAQLISTACPSCFNQFDSGQLIASRDYPQLKEKPIPVLYAVELLALAMGRSFEDIGYNLHRVKIPIEVKVQEETMKKIKTTCVYCGTGCQLWLKTKDGKVVDTKPVMPPGFNPGKGKLCIKGWNVHEFIHHPDRLTDPLIKKENGDWEKVSWEKAINYIAMRFKHIISENIGNKRVIGCLSSAKCTNEENYVMQKFARAVLKTNNIDHCARLCHSSTVVGLGAAFGSGAMTNSIDEITDAKVIFVIGSNTNEQHPLIGARILQALKKGTKLIVADPRTIPLSELAEDYQGIAIKHRPGTDVALLNGIMNVIIQEKLYDEKFIQQYCENFNAFKEEIQKMTLEKASNITGVPRKTIIQAARIIGRADTTYLIYSMGITQHTTGVDNVKSTANLQMLCGNVGKWATGVNPLRGQNNVQGACDMGALPNVFSGYQSVTDKEIQKKFAREWKIEAGEMDDGIGLTVVEMSDAAYQGDLKALYVMGENPVMSDPDSNHVRSALQKTFLIVQDIFMTSTAELAKVVLPAASFAEKEGTFTSTERRVQMVRKAIEPVGNSKLDWQIIALLAREMGYSGLNYQHASEILDEINRTTPIYGGITWERLQKNEAGLQWPCPDISHSGTIYLHQDGKFPRGKGYFHPISFKEPAELPSKEYPFILSTGRTLWHFHTGTMSRRSKTLNERVPEGYVEISKVDAEKLQINNKEMIKVATRRGEIEIKAKITHKVSEGLIFIPFHFKEAAANVLTNAALDPIAKIPEYKVCAARIEKIV